MGNHNSSGVYIEKFQLVKPMNFYQVAPTIPFNLLVDSPLLKAEWKSVSMECGGQCVMTTGTPEMPEWSAES